MQVRGWTEQQIREALATQPLPATGKRGSAMTEQIYMYLEDEGVKVWRPVPAWKVGPQTYIVLRPGDYDPDDEHWQFPPGSIVDVESRQLDGAPALVAVRSSLANRQTA